MSDEPRRVSQLTISPEEWIEIKKLAIKIYDSGQPGRDQLKCAIYAFLEWISMQEEEIYISAEMDNIIH